VGLSGLPAAGVGGLVGLGAWLTVYGVLGRSLLPRGVGRDSLGIDPRRISAAAVGGVVVLAVTGWVAAGALVSLGVMVFAGRLGGQVSLRESTARSEAIASWAEMLYSTIAAGGGLEKALIASARNAPAAIEPELVRLAARPLPEAMRAFAEDVAHPAADKVAVALILAATHGTQDLVALLKSQVESTRRQSRMDLEVEAGRARYRTSARIVVGVTVLMAVGLYVADRGYLEPYGTTTGQFVLVCVGAIFMLGFWLLIRLADTSEPQRYFGSVPVSAEATG
jgi:tight adherence protein B